MKKTVSCDIYSTNSTYVADAASHATSNEMMISQINFENGILVSTKMCSYLVLRSEIFPTA